MFNTSFGRILVSAHEKEAGVEAPTTSNASPSAARSIIEDEELRCLWEVYLLNKSGDDLLSFCTAYTSAKSSPSASSPSSSSSFSQTFKSCAYLPEKVLEELYRELSLESLFASSDDSIDYLSTHTIAKTSELLKVISYASYEHPAVHINDAMLSKMMSLLSFLVVDVEKLVNMLSKVPHFNGDDVNDDAVTNENDGMFGMDTVVRTIQGWLSLTLPTVQYFSLSSESLDAMSQLSSSCHLLIPVS